MSFTVAIDGPAAAGKGTIARTIAARFGFAHLDTGLLYRATGRRVLDGLEPVEAALRLSRDDLARPDLRSAEVATAASRVAAVPDVRRILLDFQRKFALTEPGAVLDGRDIGTVICPDAAVKLYVTASAEVRARRRLDELLTSGFDTTFDEVLADVEARDARDMERADAPLRAAADASTIDTTDLSIEEAVARAVGVVSERHDAR